MWDLFTCIPTHTYCESNGVAHVLARKALEASDFIVWMEVVPININCIMSAIDFNKISILIHKKPKQKGKN